MRRGSRVISKLTSRLTSRLIARTTSVVSSGVASGVTLVEALIAMAVLAIAGGAYASVQLSALRAERLSQERNLVATALQTELLHQRVGPNPSTGTCRVAVVPSEWECQVAAACVSGTAPCSAWAIRVEVTPANGPSLAGSTARFES